MAIRVALSIPLLEELAIAAHYNVRELAGLCRFSTRHLQRQFQRQLHCTPQKWLDEQRIKAATELLRTGMPVKQVSFELGYKQPSHFCRQFKLQNHLTPSAFAVLQNPNSVDVAYR